MRDGERSGTLVIRLALGAIFVAHGAQKLLGWWGGAGFAGTVAQFTKMGMPAPLAVLVIVAEFFGGLGVLFGALTRLAAFGIACVMVGGIFTVHLRNGFFINWSNEAGRGHGIEANLAYLAMALALCVTGPGPLSIDELLFRGSRSRGASA